MIPLIIQEFRIPQTSNWSGTFFAVSYSKPALIHNHKIDTLVVHHPIEHIGFKWPTNQKAVIWIDF